MPVPRGLEAVLFDWDGTLADSAEASFRCYVDLFASFGLSFDRDVFQRTYSPNWHRTYEAIGLDRQHWDEADSRWLARYCDEAIQLLPGAEDALVRVRAAGLRQGLVTSGDCVRVTRELESLGVAAFFETVVCAEHIQHRKPHPEGLLIALDRLGLPPKAAAYVGDSPEDVEMARAAGVFAVGIPGGFPNRQALAASWPDLLVPGLREAVQALASGV
jgi:HAD superfamily hydrolase (TIGR01509 family)